jgi:hypothetical protein
MTCADKIRGQAPYSEAKPKSREIFQLLSFQQHTNGALPESRISPRLCHFAISWILTYERSVVFGFGFNNAPILRMKISDPPGDECGDWRAVEGLAIEGSVAAL